MAFQTSRLQPTPVWLGRLRMELRQLTTAALSASHKGLLSCTFEVPVQACVAPPQNACRWLYWHQPERNHRLLGLGMALALKANGSQRFQQLKLAHQALQKHWTRIVQGERQARARAFLGFAFDPDEAAENEWQSFDNAGLYIPELLFEWENDRCLLTFNCYRDEAVHPEQVINNWMKQLYAMLSSTLAATSSVSAFLETALPPVSRWKKDVSKAVAVLQGQGLQKVVLTRQLQLKSGAEVPHRKMLEHLAQKYPACSILSVNLGQGTLLAASPEKLFEMTSEHVYCDALAGTFPANAGMADRQMERFEHAPVVQAITAALQPFCFDIKTETRATAVSLQSLSHLHTPVRARPRPDLHAIQLIDALHPTPAVGGVPLRDALTWIREHEHFSRGWYTGAFGWIGDNQEAQMSVVLRCALVQDKLVRLYAGAGITPVSDPEKELKETELKLEAMLNALKA